MLLVTGLNGHSGKWFAKRLVEERYDLPIRCILRRGTDEAFLRSLGLQLEILYGDLEDREFLEAAMKGVEVIVHIAGIRLSPLLLEIAVGNDVRRAILVHTTGIFSRFKSAAEIYQRIEGAIDLLRDKIDITILRPTMIYGSPADKNMIKLIRYIDRHALFPIFGSGQNLMQPVHARDLGRAYFDVLVAPAPTRNKSYNLPGREAISYSSLVQTVSRTLGRNTIFVRIPMWICLPAARLYNFLSSRPLVNVEQVMRMSEDKAFDYSDAKRDFGYEPLRFEDGIREEISEYLSGKD